MKVKVRKVHMMTAILKNGWLVTADGVIRFGHPEAYVVPVTFDDPLPY